MITVQLQIRVSVKAASLDDGNLDLSSGYETLDGDDYL